jgi:uncharacterized delta-60 repeat protein
VARADTALGMRFRRLGVVLGAVATAGFLAAALSAARGDLDPTFGARGKVRTDFGGSEMGWAVAVQRDGKVLVAGDRLDPGPSDDFVLARYTANGKLDSSFDHDGKAATDFGGRRDGAYDLVVQADAKIVAAGSSRQGGGSYIALARYNQDGSLDPTFGEGGKVLTAFEPTGSAGASAVLLQADGKIVAGGHTGSRFATDFALARYLPDGALDPSFGIGGRVITSISRDDDRVYGLAVQRDGRLVAAGGSFEGASNINLARYNQDGSLDPSFDRDGTVVASFAPRDMVPQDVFVQRNGKLLAAGYGGITRFTADGSLDRSFGEGGRAHSGDVEAGTAALQPDGKILVIGAVVSGTPASGDFGVARLTAGGRLDLTYGRRGTIVTAFSSGSHDEAVEGVLLPDGKLVVSGITGPTPGPETWGPWDFAVARYVAIRFCVVPNVRSKTLAAARARLTRAGCRLGTAKRTYSHTVGNGRVIAQRPRAGVRLAELAKVDLTISRGRRR